MFLRIKGASFVEVVGTVHEHLEVLPVNLVIYPVFRGILVVVLALS